MLKLKGVVLGYFLLIAGFTVSAQSIKVAVAGNMRSVMTDIKAKFLIHNPKIRIETIFGASGALAQQIINGAGFDIFISADRTYPEKLKIMGLVTGEVKTYAYGKLVLWSNTLDVSKGIEILTSKSVTKIAIAKPDVAPYGARTIECLKYYGIYDKVKDKLVFADNIAQAAQFAQSGNAEVAFLAQGLVFAPDLKGSYIYMDDKSYKPVEQACVLLKSGERNPEASKFMKFVLGTECKPIFEKCGYVVK